MISYLREVLFMTEIKACKMLFALCVVALVLPWFTYSSRVMGYCWGAGFYIYFLIPMALVAYHLFGNGAKALGVLGCAGNIAALIYSLGIWQEHHNIRGGYHFTDGVRTATACFWIAAALYVLLFVLVAASKKNASERG